jgi:hypothetical protein
VVLLAQGDDGGDPSASASITAASHVPTATCAGQVQQPQAPPDADDDLVVGSVILRGARARARDSRSLYKRRNGRDPGAKVGLSLAPGSRVVMSIDRRDRKHASLTYTEETRAAERVADGNPAVRFVSCFDDAPTGWPGGFVLTGPRCVRVVLDIKGRSKPARRTLEFGRDAC